MIKLRSSDLEQGTIQENVNSYQIIGKLELEERYGFPRSVVPWEAGIGGKLPRFDHVGVVLVKNSVLSVSLRAVPPQMEPAYMSIPLVA